MSETVTRSNFEDCAVLTLDRPEQLNTINSALVSELDAHLNALEKDASRGIILTGKGKAFCAGTDLKEHHQDIPQWLQRIHALVSRINSFPKPVIAAINGLALGGGLEFASACLFRTATESAQLGLPEVKLSVIPSYGGTQIITRLIGENRALELMLSGEPVTAEQAYSMGLINQVIPSDKDLLHESLIYLKRFTRHSRVPLNAIRTAVNEGTKLSHDKAMQFEAELAAKVGQSNDAREGVNAFLEKRKPNWRDN